MNGRSGYWLLLIVAFMIVSRPIFWTTHPPNFDFANFALGVDRFDPSQHQPQPPGYPLVILVAKIFAAAGLSIVRALYVTSLAGGIAAILGAWWLARKLGGEAGGVLASLLLAVDPVFWHSGVSSPVRIYLAAGACWLLFCCLKLAEGRRSWVWITSGLLALFAGFRPELLPLFAAPCIVAARMGGIPWRRIALGGAFCLAACVPWVLWVASTFGSPLLLPRTCYYYFLHHASTTSVLLGAPRAAWQDTLQDALTWNAIAASVVVLAILQRPFRLAVDRRFFLLAGLFFLPAIALQALVHLPPNGPDQCLGTIAVLCVTGGSLLATGACKFFRSAILACAVGSMLLVSFVLPLEPSLRSFARDRQSLAQAIRSLRAALRSGDAILVLDDSAVSWRILEYEFPQNIVFALPAGYQFLHRRGSVLSGKEISLPAVDRLQIFSDPTDTQQKVALDRLCAQFRCESYPSRVQAEPGAWRGSLSLPPYTLRFE